jgi:hypothetical protein
MDDSADRPAGSNDVTPDRLAIVEEQQAQLAETLRALTATVKRLAETVSARSTTTSTTGRPAAQPVSAGELVAWVSWLVERCELDIPACWPQHGAILEELDALRIGCRTGSARAREAWRRCNGTTAWPA